MRHIKFLYIIFLLSLISCGSADTGNAAKGTISWLPYASTDKGQVCVDEGISSPTIDIACRELRGHWDGAPVNIHRTTDGDAIGKNGFAISQSDSQVDIYAPDDLGILYGVYALLRNPELGRDGRVEESPFYDLRLLNHWDNLNGTIERGYAGKSLWKWEELPDSVSPRYEEYARANAAIGINGAVLNNVNASPKILSEEYLKKVAVLADIFRPYGIKVYLSVNFASPMVLDSLPTADPLNPEVVKWWTGKADEIYSLIPDFGGFLVKANSEGQPGPMDFGRTHADGANMLAEALKPHDGVVMWRAFVYSPADADRAKQAYLEFQPLDGKFADNVIIQIKNGPVDFQPREPYSPLFSAMAQTDVMAEFQITQEYLGHANHLAYLAPMWTEFFDYVQPFDAIAGVANIGDDDNWTGHPLAQANWYAFGRLAWNPQLTSTQIADEWLSMALVDKARTPEDVYESLLGMFDTSREAVVDYMMPLGLHHLFAFGHHYGPEPWCDVEGARPDWLPKYYHRADSIGLGFDRSPSGSNAVGQYPEPLRSQLASVETCPEEFLLWFHHVPWSHRMKSGNTLWEELCIAYQRGVEKVEEYQQTWEKAEPYISPELYADVETRLATQLKDAKWWRDACLQYFAQYSKMPIPAEIASEMRPLEELMKIHLPITNYKSPTPALLDSLR
ncbi:alpha-glucuronidase [uncultured Duncaniella sp.]|uniref:alpha-glucuronidase n=6 Tax=uncultured Duncaniella sp. TaxID=2768039 RepID=UPI0025D4437E|nr:alpha-glucuronidase [uncultured Duncaniella sp.]